MPRVKESFEPSMPTQTRRRCGGQLLLHVKILIVADANWWWVSDVGNRGAIAAATISRRARVL